MLTFPTLAERQAAAAASRKDAVAAICNALSAFARAHGGRFLLYGSAAEGRVRADSDIDLLIDFPADTEAKAWRFAEETCGRWGIPADISPLAWWKAEFVARVRPGWRVLG
jgi:predicted nucleotidyltransferase